MDLRQKDDLTVTKRRSGVCLLKRRFRQARANDIQHCETFRKDVKLRLAVQEPCSGSLGSFSQLPWVANRNAQLRWPFAETPISNVQSSNSRKHSVGRDHTDSPISWFYKRKKGVLDKWSDLPTQLVSNRSGMRPKFSVSLVQSCV